MSLKCFRLFKPKSIFLLCSQLWSLCFSAFRVCVWGVSEGQPCEAKSDRFIISRRMSLLPLWQPSGSQPNTTFYSCSPCTKKKESLRAPLTLLFCFTTACHVFMTSLREPGNSRNSFWWADSDYTPHTEAFKYLLSERALFLDLMWSISLYLSATVSFPFRVLAALYFSLQCGSLNFCAKYLIYH